MVNYQEKRKQAKASQRDPQSQVILFYLLISPSAFHLRSGDDIASPRRHIMKINILMSLKHFDCQRNAHNYINNSVLRVGFEKFKVKPCREQGGDKTFNSCFAAEPCSSLVQNREPGCKNKVRECTTEEM